MKTEFTITMIVKLFSFLLGLTIAYQLNAGNDEISRLVFIVGFSNLARMFDGSLPYIRRIEFASKRDLITSHQLNINVLIYGISFLICASYLNDLALSALTVLCSLLYAQMSYYFNVLAKSYFLNLPQIIGITSCLFFKFNIFEDIAYQFLVVTFISSLLCFFFISFMKFSEFSKHSFSETYSSNYFFNFLSVLVFMIYAEFASVVLYGNISESEYMDTNKIVKIQQAMIGGVSAITAVLWNRYNTQISKLDKLTVNSFFVISVYLITLLFATLMFFSNSFINEFFEENMILLISSTTYIIFSSFNLIISQQMFRKSLSKRVFLLSVFEALVMIGIFILWEDIVYYFILIAILHLLKFILSKIMFRRFA